MPRSRGSIIVALRGGVLVPLEVLQFVWRIEDGGGSICVVGGQGAVTPGTYSMTAKDTATLKQHNSRVKRLVKYCDEIECVV